MVTWDESHGMATWDGSHGMVTWDGHMGWVTWDGHTSFETWVPIRGKHFLQNWGIYKMCDIQISDKILKTPHTEMRFSQDSHKLAI